MISFLSVVQLPMNETPVGYTVLDHTGAVLSVRTTEGINEVLSGEGFSVYSAYITVSAGDPRVVLWDNGEHAERRPIFQFTPVSQGVAVSTARMPKIENPAVAGYTLYDIEGDAVTGRITSEIQRTFEGDIYDIYQAVVSPPPEIEEGIVLWDNGEGGYVFEIFRPGVSGVVGGSDGSDVGSDIEEPIMRTIRFCVAKDGELLILDTSPVFANPSNTYGVSRLDGQGHVLLAGTTLQHSGGGVYGRTFEEPDELLQYRFYVRSIIEDAVYVVPGTTVLVNSAMLAIGRYTDSTMIAARFGYDNLHKWLSLPGGDLDEPVDYALRAWGHIFAAEAEIDEAIHGEYFSGPFEDVVPQKIRELATLLAGVMMYEARGLEDVDDEGGGQHRLRPHERRVREELRRIKYGYSKIEGAATPTSIPKFY